MKQILLFCQWLNKDNKWAMFFRFIKPFSSRLIVGELSIILMESSLEYYDYRSGQILQQNLFRIYCNLCVVLSWPSSDGDEGCMLLFQIKCYFSDYVRDWGWDTEPLVRVPGFGFMPAEVDRELTAMTQVGKIVVITHRVPLFWYRSKVPSSAFSSPC